MRWTKAANLLASNFTYLVLAVPAGETAKVRPGFALLISLLQRDLRVLVKYWAFEILLWTASNFTYIILAVPAGLIAKVWPGFALLIGLLQWELMILGKYWRFLAGSTLLRLTIGLLQWELTVPAKYWAFMLLLWPASNIIYIVGPSGGLHALAVPARELAKVWPGFALRVRLLRWELMVLAKYMVPANNYRMRKAKKTMMKMIARLFPHRQNYGMRKVSKVMMKTVALLIPRRHPIEYRLSNPPMVAVTRTW